MEATRHRLVVSVQYDMGRLGAQALGSRLDGHPRGLLAAELAPVDAEEDPLFRRARGNRARRRGALKPSHVARHGKGEGGGPAQADVDEAVSEGVVGVDGHHRVTAT